MMKKKKEYSASGIDIKKKKAFVILIIAGAALFGIAVMLSLSFNTSANTIVFTVNDEPVTKEEFQKSMAELKSVTFAYFVERYDAEDTKSFWTNDYNGEVPLEILKSDAVKEIKKIRVKQIIAKQNGIESYLNYTDFKKSFVDENARRKKAKTKSEPLFGPIQYEERAYYRYVLGNMEEKLIIKLAKSTLAVTESEEKKYYEANKEQYLIADDIEIERIIMAYQNEKDSEKSQNNKNRAKELCEQIKSKIEENGSFKDVAKYFSASNEVKITYETRVFNDKTRKYDTLIPNVLTQAQTLPIGQISNIIEVKGSSFDIIRVLGRKSLGYKTIEEVREIMNKKLLTQKFNNLVTEMLSKANVVINEEVYKKVNFD